MLEIASLGYPQAGIKDAVALWRAGAIDDWRLAALARAIRQAGWSAQKAAGVTHIASGEAGYGDPMAETAAMIGAVPASYGPDIGRATLEVRLAMAGDADPDATAPWAGSHLRYHAPLLRDDHRWRLSSSHPVAEQLEARAFGVVSRPVLIGPISFLLHCRTEDGTSPLAYLDRVLPAYQEMLAQFAVHGADWVQIDEPALADCSDDMVIQAFARAYEQLAAPATVPNLLVAAYGGAVTGAMEALAAAPVDGLHLDLVAAPGQLESVARLWPAQRTLSIGIVDAISPARTNLAAALRRVQDAVELLGPGRLQIAPSRPLTAAPVDLARAPLDLAREIETAADKLYALRQIADAAVGDIDLPDDVTALPARPDVATASLQG